MDDDRTAAAAADASPDADPELADGDVGDVLDDRPNWQGWDDDPAFDGGRGFFGEPGSAGAFARPGGCAP